MPICFHVVPEPAARRMKQKISTSSSVRRCVLPSSSVISAATSTLMRSSRGSSRRACTIGGTMRANAWMPRPSEVTASRMSSASATDTPRLPVIVSSGMAEKNSTLRSAATVGLHAVEQRVDRAHDPPLGPPRRALRQERRLHQGAVAPVLGAVHVEDAGVGETRRVLGRRLRHVGLAVAEHRVARGPVERRPVRTVRVRQALEEPLAGEADQRPDDAFVHRARLAQPVRTRGTDRWRTRHPRDA